MLGLNYSEGSDTVAVGGDLTEGSMHGADCVVVL